LAFVGDHGDGDVEEAADDGGMGAGVLRELVLELRLHEMRD
jgi:hypothetical protein